ncbi:hypothetical protein IGI42_003214 [Enterococcus sp. AZ109]
MFFLSLFSLVLGGATTLDSIGNEISTTAVTSTEISSESTTTTTESLGINDNDTSTSQVIESNDREEEMMESNDEVNHDSNVSESNQEQLKYVSITNENYVIWKQPGLEKLIDQGENQQKTFLVNSSVDYADTKYYAINNKDGLVGYIAEDEVTEAPNSFGVFYEEKTYGSITETSTDLLAEDLLTVIASSETLKNKTFYVRGFYNDFYGERFYKIYDYSESFVGIVNEKSIELTDSAWGKKHEMLNYITVTNSNDQIWKDFEFETGLTTETLKNKTLQTKENYYHVKGIRYFSIYDNKGVFLGYLAESSLSIAPTAGGKWQSTDQYVTVTKNDWTIWKDFAFKNGQSTKPFFNKTYRATGYYNHYNGNKYYSLYDSQGNWQGYINEGGVTSAPTPGGKWQSTDQYVTVTKNDWTIWKDFAFKNGQSTKPFFNKTYRATGYYNHYNGNKYYSLYDSQGNWQGYINEGGVTSAPTPGGKWQSTDQYVTVTKNDWTIWKDFAFKNGQSTKPFFNKTYRATGYYNHYNGNKYYSLYDSQGNWQGYINEGGVTSAPTPGGKWQSADQYVTVAKNDWTIWKDFDFKNGQSTSSLFSKTYKATGYYNHYNGNKYYSLYDSKGNWQGYINEGGVKKASGKQGTGFSANKSVLVIRSGYSIWSDFNWNQKITTNSLINNVYEVKWYYKHMNGSTYYSLYEKNGKWLGYVNSDAVRERKGVAAYLGTSRQRVINELSAHEHDRFYLGTPFRGLSSSNPEPFLSPAGAPNSYGAGMNCTGFVACVTRRSGGDLNRISGITQGWGSYANAYNWRDALIRNSDYFVYNTVDELLRAGKARKGDLIYFDPVWTDPFYDSHIGFFWGNSSSENKIWHQVLAGNQISHIYSGTRYSKVYLFPQD